MGKERNKSYGQRHPKPYRKDGWKNQRNRNGNFSKDSVKFEKRRHEFIPKVNLREDQVGITEFVTSGPGFTGVVKSRFSDFHVNEIDTSGKVLLLDDLNIPKLVEDTLSAEEVAAARQELNEVITPELWTKIEELADAKQGDKNDKPIEIEVGELDKEKRTQIHKMLKKLYVGKLVSTTVDQVAVSTPAESASKANKMIKIMKSTGGRDQNRNRWTFPGEFVHFLVHKENMDTSEVAAAMAEKMNLRPSQVNYCGTKDKRAKTTQKFCIKRRTPQQIVGSVKGLYNVHVGNFEFSSDVLKLGNLKGNRFRIALRHISGDNEAIEGSLQAMREKGFINYFGLQRFGNCASVPTYEVGVALLKSDYKLACELILKPRDNDIHFMRSIREAWWKNRNSAAAAAMFRCDKFIEKKVLDGLAQYGENDYSAALRKIPRNMLLLYPHAFQSLIFNRVASRRINEFGIQLIPGDLVYRNKDELDMDFTELPVPENDEGAEDRGETPEIEVETTAATTKCEEPPSESIFKRKVKPLTADDITSGSYTIFDMVLPLPGYDVTYPDNEVGAWYEEILLEYGLSSDKLRHNVKTYAMSGAYRKLFVQPTEMSWEFRTYDSAESTLITSDWEQLRSRKEPLATGAAEGKFKALLLDFCLPTSVYATMMLRELLKTDTSAANQTQLEKEELKKFADESSTDAKTEADVVAVDLPVEKRKAVTENGEDNSSVEAKKHKVADIPKEE